MRHEEDRVTLRRLLFGNRQFLLDPVTHGLGVTIAVAGLVRAGGDEVEAINYHMAVRVHIHHALVQLLFCGSRLPVRVKPGVMIAHDI